MITLVENIADHIRRCPEVLAELDGNADAVAAYTDLTTSESNSLTRAVYMQANGSVLVAWMGTSITEGEMEAWNHSVSIYVRARKQQSPLRLLNAIIDGTPEGTDLRWRYQCVHDMVNPMSVSEVARDVDEEGIDSYVIRAGFKEKGDFSYALSGQ